MVDSSSLADYLAARAQENYAVKQAFIEQCADEFTALTDMLTAVFESGRRLYICGNGGSAGDSSHMATELIVRLTSQRNRQALPAIALTADTSILTACGNDYGFEQIFARQVQVLGKPGDVLILISTSGNSANLIKAAGGNLNAGTSFSYTMYYIVVPSSAFSTALEVQADAMMHSTFDPDEFIKERGL